MILYLLKIYSKKMKNTDFRQQIFFV